MHCRSQSGEGSSEFRAFDGRLGTAVVLHVGEKKRVVLVATGLLDRISGRGADPCFREQRIALRFTFQTSGSFALLESAEYEPARLAS